MRTRLILAVAVAVLLWASSFSIIRSAITANPNYGAGAMALLRFGVASIVLAIYTLATKQFNLPQRSQLLPVFACGFLGISLYHVLLNYGEMVVSAGAASLLINSSPLWTTLLAVPMLRESLTRRKGLGIAAGFVGVLLITLGKTDRGGGGGHYFDLHPAAFAILGSAVCTSFYVIFQKKFMHHHSPLQFTAWSIWAGTLILLPIFAYDLVTAMPRVAAVHTLEIVYLGIFPAAVAYFTFAYATKHLPAARVMSYLYLVPPLSMLLAWFYPGLHEIPTLTSLCGGALAIAGVAIVNSAPSKSQVPVAIEEA